MITGGKISIVKSLVCFVKLIILYEFNVRLKFERVNFENIGTMQKVLVEMFAFECAFQLFAIDFFSVKEHVVGILMNKISVSRIVSQWNIVIETIKHKHFSSTQIDGYHSRSILR